MRQKLICLMMIMTGFTVNASTLVTNVKGYTLDDSGKLITFSSLLFDQGKVKALDPHQPDAEEVIDGKGHIMMPGLIDAHGHLLGLGDNLLKVDLRNATSEKEAAKNVSEYALGKADLNWITGRGWNQELWSDRAFPTKASLDELNINKPIWLTRVDGHAGWANSKAMEIAGITKSTQDPIGGEIIRDAQGNATGVLIDKAMDLVEKHMPGESAPVMNAQLRAAGKHLVSLGITSMHDAGIGHSTYTFYLAKAVEHDLPLRIYAMVSATDPQLDHILERGKIIDPDGMLVIRSVKAYGDGALGSRGAALLKPYSDAKHQHGLLLTAQNEMPRLFNKVINAGFQLNYHAIGDKANRLALDQFERTFNDIGGRDLRNRIEHAQVIASKDLPRFAQLSVLPSMQPTHATSDKNMAEDRVGKDRIKGAYAWQTLLKSGVKVPLGSDFPVELANPFYGIHAAVTRQDRDNQPVKGWYPEEALTVKQAFKGFTLDAAYAAHMEEEIGTLTPGKRADFIFVDSDIFTIPATDIWKTKVLATWIDGNQVYRAE
ncbi:amidohydrolase [Alteromonas sp. ASW11-130]|uniref:amidohydrolase n=1 Tax=Alteromonas sp. ASW11-130 TaxID=3015775 RepID=UPI002241A04D|nr:amidohydrolase [Alteromonas sp. ASW11-130]MCW8092653.1 amidohydrolase [Alteromonas sp. ASW11-130]